MNHKLFINSLIISLLIIANTSCMASYPLGTSTDSLLDSTETVTTTAPIMYTPSPSGRVYDGMVNIDDGIIIYSTYARHSETKDGMKVTQLKLYAMSSIGQNIAVLNYCFVPAAIPVEYNLIAASWKDDGTILAVACEGKILFYDLRDPEFFRVNAIDFSDEYPNKWSPQPEINIPTLCGNVSQMIWEKDKDTLLLLCEHYESDNTERSLCEVPLKLGSAKSVLGNDYLTVESGKTDCRELLLFDNVNEINGIQTFKRSPENNTILFSFRDGANYQTYLFHPETDQVKFLFSGLGSSWSLDGKRIARTLRFPNPIPELSEGCLLEYDLDTGENHVLYCPYRPNGPNGMGDSYYLFSIR
ncbi:MAG: hypothetical protein ABFD79_18910, partial [Phycisphaerales bacterium]